ncbi:Peroxidase 16 [Hibiscus syriacus]|uniref:peroxidase n=1 Tax=Hibiscus syriacus TaxID=106335 RepID=A0A6A3BJ06_HIBSY|nr:Peroxidase 16 [Hibiscus syriacus]
MINVNKLTPNSMGQHVPMSSRSSGRSPTEVPANIRDCSLNSPTLSTIALFVGNVEKDHPDDIPRARDGFDTVIKAKAAVDSNPRCRNKVTCAEILALATREVVLLVSPQYYVCQPRSLSDRYDRVIRCTHLRVLPLRSFFSNRIYNFSPRNPIDPTLNIQYAMQLRQMCPRIVDPTIAINMDPNTPGTFDNVYYKNLQQEGSLHLRSGTVFGSEVEKHRQPFASSNAAFNQAFVAAVTKLGRVGVLTGNQGEIRRDCTRPN